MINAIFSTRIKAGIAYYGDCYQRPSFWTRAKAFLPYKLADLLIFPKVRSISGRNIKFCVGGGAPLELGQQQFFKALGVPIYQAYGLTEAVPVIASNVPGGHKLGSSGKVMSTIEGRDLPPGEKGEIVIRGDNVMAGNFKNPAATAKTLKQGWLVAAGALLILIGNVDENLLALEVLRKWLPAGALSGVCGDRDGGRLGLFRAR